MLRKLNKLGVQVKETKVSEDNVDNKTVLILVNILTILLRYSL